MWAGLPSQGYVNGWCGEEVSMERVGCDDSVREGSDDGKVDGGWVVMMVVLVVVY